MLGTQTAGGEKTFSASGGLHATGNLIDLIKSRSGDDLLILVDNTSNTASSQSVLKLQVAGTSAGDAFLHLSISGVTDWSLGPDNSDSDKFKISKNATLGTNDFLVINPNGNVGIGTATPNVQLEIHGEIDVGHNIPASIVNSGLINLRLGILNSTPTNVNDSYIAVQDSGGPGALAGDLLFIPRSNVASSIRMFTGTTTPLERVTIRASGNVGIGTISPNALLDVKGTIQTSSADVIASLDDPIGIIDFYSNDVSAGASGVRGRIAVRNNFVGAWDGTAANEDTYMEFTVAKNRTISEAMRIESSGNVGIGTDTPNALLDVTSSVSGSRVAIDIKNLSNTAGSDARLRLRAAGASGGDALIEFEINAVESWTIGADNSDGDGLKISRNASLG